MSFEGLAVNNMDDRRGRDSPFSAQSCSLWMMVLMAIIAVLAALAIWIGHERGVSWDGKTPFVPPTRTLR